MPYRAQVLTNNCRYTPQVPPIPNRESEPYLSNRQVYEIPVLDTWIVLRSSTPIIDDIDR